MPCFNSERFLNQAVESVLKQSYQNWELILINDQSTDNTVKIIEALKERDSRIKFIDLIENGGVANARNEGIKAANGDYIAFLDSDDHWDEDKLRTQLLFMIENNYALTHTAYRRINVAGAIITNKISVSAKVNYNDLLRHNEIGCLTAIFNVNKLGKRYFLKIGHEDYAFWLDVLRNEIYSYGLNIALASYRVHNNTVSSNKYRAAGFRWRIYREIEGMSLFKSSINFLFYAFNSLTKYLKEK